VVAREEEVRPTKDNVRGIFGKHWTARDVYRVKNEIDIKKETEERFGHKPGTQRFMGHYQQVITENFKAMQANDHNQLQDLVQEAEEWNRIRPPKDEQRRLVSK
jgi:hypothetical protein